MATWNSARLARSIQDGSMENLYCLYGEETLLIEEATKGLTQLALGEGVRDFNVDVFFGGEVSGQTIRDALETLPMMTSKRIVIVRNGQNLKSKELDAILPLIENPIDTSVLILQSSAVDQRKKFYQKFKNTGVIVKFDRVSDRELELWVREFVKREGKEISLEASQLLQQMIGPNLLEMQNEIKKVSQFIADKKEIEGSDVREVVSETRIESVFKLTNAIGDRARADALVYLAKLLEHGENALGILALLSRHFRILLAIQEGTKAGLSKPQLCSKAGVPMFFLTQYLVQCRKWKWNQLKAFHKILLETDQALKSSPVSQHIWLENLVIKTCSL